MYKYFKLEEFDSPDEKGSGENMDKEFLTLLSEARELANIPFKINSGYRTKEHNLKVGGRVGSSHLKGVAVDIACNNSVERSKILKGLFGAGLGRRVGIATNFIHVDADYDKPAAIWLYK
ncbi:MAG: peptidase M15 [Aequorivita sp.]|nr:peptidase M15 [Aequorivita sp.]